MKIFITIFLTAAVCAGFGGACSAETASKTILENGLTVLIKEAHRSPLTAIEAGIRCGSADEAPYTGSGIAHFTEHMVFKGTKRWPNPTDIERLIKSYGGYINGFTSHDDAGFQIIVPSEYTVQALEVMKELLNEAAFDPAETEKERNVILKEIRLKRDEPASYLSQLLWATMFTSHNYRFPVIGREELLKKITRADLLSYYKSRYTPGNTVLAVAGDVDTAAVSKKIDEIFGGAGAGFPASSAYAQEPQQITALSRAEQKDTALTYLALGFRGVRLRDKDLFSLDVLSMLLGDGRDSRLFKAVYADKKLVYTINSANYTPKDPGIFGITAVCGPENAQKAVEAIWQEIEEIKKAGPSVKELSKAKNQVISGYIFSRQTAQGEAAGLVGGEIEAGDYDFSRKYIEGIQAVTPESVRIAAIKYLDPQDSTLVQLTPPQNRLASEKQRPAAAGGLLSDVDAFTLKNGLRVLLIEDRSLPIISVNAVGLGGLRTENSKDNGIANLASETLLCGSRSMSEEETFSRIESAGGSLNSYAGSNSFGLAASGLSKDADLILGVFAASLQDPVFAQDKIEREKTAVSGAIKATDDDIYSSGMRTLKYILFRRHPYRFQGAGRLNTVAQTGQADIVGYYRRYYRPGNMVLVVAGDIDKKAMRAKIAALFGKFAGGPAARIDPPKEKKHHRPRIVSRRAEKEQSLVLLGYPGSAIYGYDKYVLGVLCSVLSGVNGRLCETVREKKGLAYTLNVIPVSGIEPGFIIFYVGTTSENIEAVKKELFSEIGRLKQEGITDAELRSAKSELIGLRKIGLQTIGELSMQAGLDELYGLGWADTLRYDSRINRVTRAAVIKAAQRYFRPDSYVLLSIRGVK